RPEPLSDNEAEILGLRTAVRVARAREATRERKYVTWTQGSYYPFEKTYTFDEKGVRQVVSDVWPECAGYVSSEPPVGCAQQPAPPIPSSLVLPSGAPRFVFQF
ncbi:uncharacterized protein PHACADRAFT_202701, partial [Phanerochaete carnosa HHB-10118-sp]